MILIGFFIATFFSGVIVGMLITWKITNMKS
jgi:hypothetical protein